MTSSDRRSSARVEVMLAAGLERSGERQESVMRDLSIGGAFIATTLKVAYGEAVVVHTRLPGIDQEVALRATVQWTSPDGCGVQFGAMGVRETHAILELISKRASG